MDRDYKFCALLFLLATVLYLNTLPGGFVWDDRAAIVSNPDVLGRTTLRSLLTHDFWGQDMTDPESHKSFRPIVVLSFRLNHFLHGLEAWGYHLGNVIIYSSSVVAWYVVASQWLSSTGARVAALLFCFHPCHVEAVASLVGRADSLCGLFYFLAMYTFTNSIREKDGLWSWNGSVNLCASLLSAFAASMSKELGITVFGILFGLQLLEDIAEEAAAGHSFRRTSTSTSSASSQDSDSDSAVTAPVLTSPVVSKKNALHWSIAWLLGEKEAVLLAGGLLRSFTKIQSQIRLGLCLTSLAALTVIRVRMNGKNTLYQWTILENHISLLPSFQVRALSYGQTHFWYLLKLLFPRYLSFDYGYACIPIVSSIFDVRNLLVVGTYVAVFGVLLYAVRYLFLALLVGWALTIVPLIPALNILFPVGTLLAERLLFIPSAGLCLLVGHAVASDALQPYWASYWTMVRPVGAKTVDSHVALSAEVLMKANHHMSPTVLVGGVQRGIGRFGGAASDSVSPCTSRSTSPIPDENRVSSRSKLRRKREARKIYQSDSPIDEVTSTRMLYVVFLLPLCVLGAVRVITRNVDWNSEIQIYRSALDVCPLSVKALSNFASLVLAEGDHENSILSSSTASQLFDEHLAAFINAGVAYTRVGQNIRSIHLLQRALALSPKHSKAKGYLGSSMSAFVEVAGSPRKQALMRQLAADTLDEAISSGFDSPSILHVRGSIAIDQGDANEAVYYLRAALEKNRLAKQGDSPESDGVNEPLTWNQLGNAFISMNRYEEAVAAMQEGLRADPTILPLYVNLGLALRTVQGDAAAKDMYERGLAMASEMGVAAPIALINNLGLIYLETEPQKAAEMFQNAYDAIRSQRGPPRAGEGNMKSLGSDSVEDILKDNLNRAKEKLRSN